MLSGLIELVSQNNIYSSKENNKPKVKDNNKINGTKPVSLMKLAICRPNESKSSYDPDR